MTRIYKNSRDGWTAETLLHLDGGRVLNVLTMKRHNGQIATSCQAGISTEHGFSFIFTQDFRRTINCSTNRCTEKNVRDLHKLALDQEAALIDQANEFYQSEA